MDTVGRRRTASPGCPEFSPLSDCACAGPHGRRSQ